MRNAYRQPALQKEQPQKRFRSHEHKSLWASENQLCEERLKKSQMRKQCKTAVEKIINNKNKEK